MARSIVKLILDAEERNPPQDTSTLRLGARRFMRGRMKWERDEEQSTSGKIDGLFDAGTDRGRLFGGFEISSRPLAWQR